jgi:hypothetical protein
LQTLLLNWLFEYTFLRVFKFFSHIRSATINAFCISAIEKWAPNSGCWAPSDMLWSIILSFTQYQNTTTENSSFIFCVTAIYSFDLFRAKVRRKLSACHNCFYRLYYSHLENDQGNSLVYIWSPWKLCSQHWPRSL